jgi:flagellar biosynthesis component FlhA
LLLKGNVRRHQNARYDNKIIIIIIIIIIKCVLEFPYTMCKFLSAFNCFAYRSFYVLLSVMFTKFITDQTSIVPTFFSPGLYLLYPDSFPISVSYVSLYLSCILIIQD